MSCVAIIGLGNPGSKYNKTRHNLGFWFLDNLASSHGITFQSKSKFKSDISKFTYNDRSYMLVKPLTFMNQSGKYLRSLLTTNSCDIEESILVHDELTLSVGQMKISKGKSAGGHNGVKSIFDELGNSLTRLRLGIGQKENPHMELSDYVLSTFNPSENRLLQSRFDHFLSALQSMLNDGIDRAMNIYNQPIKN